MRYLSVCSGIEAASAAWMPLGWRPVAFSEIEPFPTSVLAHHHPGVPNWGDMTKYKEWPDEPIDLLCGGTPCQSFSVAGLRKGLDDPRGNLMLTFGAIAAKYRPKWLVWENVPGVLSSNGGRDFGTFLGMLGQLGYGFAYRVLDAQYFGVAQRRRRVFVVGCLGDWRSAAAVLFERHSLQGHPAPSRQAGKVAPTIPSRSTGGGGLGTDFDCDGGLICMAHGQGGAEITAGERSPTLACNHEAPVLAFSCKDYGADAGPLSPTLRAMGHAGSHANAGGQVAVCVTGDVFHTLRADGHDASEDGTGRGTPLVPVAMINMQGSKGNAVAQADGPSFTLNAMHGHDMHAVAVPVGVTIHGTDPTVQKVASYDELAQCLRARTPGNIDNSSTTVVQQPVAYGTRTANTSSNGWGIQEEHTHTLDCAQGVAVAQPVAHAIQAGALRVNPASGPDGVGVQADHAYTLEARAEVQAVAYTTKLHNTGSNNAGKIFEERTTCLDANSPPPVLLTAMQVRRLTPTEAERLMGFPDGYTAIPWRGKPADQCPDGPRYKALGNSWAVPVVRWIGERIEAVEAIAQQKVEAA